jgi:2-iminobutanoate/2-iminopropanoate deaminase
MSDPWLGPRHPAPLKKSVISAPDAPAGTGPYSPCLRVGDWVYVSGQGPLDPRTHAVVGQTIEEQTHSTFANISALLRAAGSALPDVVKVNVYLSDIAHYDRFNSVYATLFSEPYPVRTTVGCALVDILIEVDCIAISHLPAP